MFCDLTCKSTPVEMAAQLASESDSDDEYPYWMEDDEMPETVQVEWDQQSKPLELVDEKASPVEMDKIFIRSMGKMVMEMEYSPKMTFLEVSAVVSKREGIYQSSKRGLNMRGEK